jgi:hypothetical protein
VTAAHKGGCPHDCPRFGMPHWGHESGSNSCERQSAGKFSLAEGSLSECRMIQE